METPKFNGLQASLPLVEISYDYGYEKYMTKKSVYHRCWNLYPQLPCDGRPVCEQKKECVFPIKRFLEIRFDEVRAAIKDF